MSGPLSNTGPQPRPHSGRLPQLLRRGSSKRIHPTGPATSATSVTAAPAGWRASASGGGAYLSSSAAGPHGKLTHHGSGELTAGGTHGAGQALPPGSKSHHSYSALRTQVSNLGAGAGAGAGAAAAALSPVRCSANGVRDGSGVRGSRDTQPLSPACQPSTPLASPHPAARLSSAGARSSGTAAAATDAPYGLRPSAGGTVAPGDANDSQRSNIFSIPRHYSGSSFSSQAPDSRVASSQLELITPGPGPVENSVLPSAGAAYTRVSYTGVGGARSAVSPQGPPGQPTGSMRGLRSPQSRLGQRALMAGGVANQGIEDRGVSGAGGPASIMWVEPAAAPSAGSPAGSLRYGQVSAPDADALGGRLVPGGTAVVAWSSSQGGGAARALAKGQVKTAGEGPAVGGAGSLVLDEIQPASEDGSRRGGRAGGLGW